MGKGEGAQGKGQSMRIYSYRQMLKELREDGAALSDEDAARLLAILIVCAIATICFFL